MINKQSIYYWFFFPLLALLSAGSLTSCIYDSVLEETDMSGKSTLSITMRGVTTNPNDGYDEYIKTLRIIGFDANERVVCNQLFDYDANTTEIPNFTVQGTGEDAQINITQTMEDAFQGGVCDFYFIANEEGYSVYTNGQVGENLSSFLGTIGNLEQEPKKDVLDKCVIATPTQTQIATLGSSPILMTTSVRSTLKPGDNTINNIELVRCFAKVQLKIIDQTKSANVGDNPVLEVTYPSYYSLWDESQDANWISNASKVNINLELVTETIEQDNQSYPLFTSQEIYFPERLFAIEEDNKETNALKFSFTLNNKPYTIAVADETGTDFNIRRNTHYTVIATLKKKNEVTLTVLINKWDEKSMGVEFN